MKEKAVGDGLYVQFTENWLQSLSQLAPSPDTPASKVT
jgi:hypothetical protein